MPKRWDRIKFLRGCFVAVSLAQDLIVCCFGDINHFFLILSLRSLVSFLKAEGTLTV